MLTSSQESLVVKATVNNMAPRGWFHILLNIRKICSCVLLVVVFVVVVVLCVFSG